MEQNAQKTHKIIFCVHESKKLIAGEGDSLMKSLLKSKLQIKYNLLDFLRGEIKA